ncbi:MAG: CAP domain-containing protein [Bacteroidales bacterium]|nr:CAP domain-containing protein [Bacteroidales bacterium]
MKKTFITALVLMLCIGTAAMAAIPESTGVETPYQQNEAKKAFDFINNVRQHPSLYTSQTGVDLSGVKSKPALAWNNQLAQAAQKKAQDMATRNYFGNVDPDGYGMNYHINKAGYTLESGYLSKKDANYFESITATFQDGAEAVKYLIKDGGASNQHAGHRRLLLGIDDFYSDCTDIGIGVYYNPNSTYKYYWCILVAKHGKTSNPSPNNNRDKGLADNGTEQQAAANYLNKIRQNPAAFSQEMGVSLSGIAARQNLNWNPQLAAAAQRKAQDMADRGYFAHVDPDGYGMNFYINKAGYTLTQDFLRNKADNYFESISAGTKTGQETIKNLIYDGGANNANAGHRIHLLGIDNFWANCTDIGVGMGYNPNSPYKYYWCVLVAKHNF